VRYVWSRGGASALAAGLIRLGKALVGPHPPLHPSLSRQERVREGPGEGEGEAEREAAREAMFRRPLARRLWPWLILLDATWTYGRQVGWPLRRGQIVVCDRYVPDTLAELGARLHDARIAERPAGRLLRWLNRRPHCAWYLALPAEVARKRQPAEIQQGTLELAERCAGVYNALLSSYALRIVDGAAPADALSDRLVYETLTDYFDNYWSLLNALLLSNPKACSRGGARATDLPARPAPMPYIWSQEREGEP
jgi:thymidylate kinase